MISNSQGAAGPGEIGCCLQPDFVVGLSHLLDVVLFGVHPLLSSLLFLLALVLYLPPIQPSGPPNLRSAGLLPTADCLFNGYPPASSGVVSPTQ